MLGSTIQYSRTPADDIYNLVQPDISVICDRDKLSNGKRCIGAPDWVIEVVSPSTKAQDYIIKRGKYHRLKAAHKMEMGKLGIYRP